MAEKTAYAIHGDEFIIEDYNNAKAFASFLPAIAGLWGKPLWVYYVNRGQAIANFGVKDKDGAMLEFVAANKAWRQTALQGFRTFYKVNGTFYEPFRNIPGLKAKKITQTMYIKTHSVRLVDRNEVSGIETSAEFFTLPNENFPALLRRLTIKNISGEAKEIECIDGMPLLHPVGTRNGMLKNLSRLAEGWFTGVNFSPKNIPYYKLLVEALDRPEIVPLYGANFYCGLIKGSGAPQYCIDPDAIFGEQRDYDFPAVFMEQNGSFVNNTELRAKNKTPSGMGYFSLKLAPGADTVYDSMIGYCSDYQDVDRAAAMLTQNNFFETKEKENAELIQSVASCARTESAYPQFDTYCAQNFIDNALRGGFPLTIGKNTTYYAYSRVHGDMEREYNNFVVLDEYFSQGNGNYRDVNQNRRCDIFFNRDVGDDNIHFFMNLIQSDGFNPLKVMGVRFVFETAENRQHFLDDVARNAQNADKGFTEKLAVYTTGALTIGGLFHFFEENKITLSDRGALLASLLQYSKKTSLAEHGEGYWSDHWHYNTDLIENYLAIFPDRYEQLLLGRNDYIFYDDCYFVEPRSIKYILFRGMPRQMRAVRKDPEKAALIASRTNNPNATRTDFGKGAIYYTNLLGKLLSLVANKYASLDPEGLGVEMEANKPNWCDALNGLPGLFGSSSAESLELLRLVSFLNQSLAALAPATTTAVTAEIAELLKELARITKTATDNFSFWDQTHTIKEQFREKTRLGISGAEENLTIGTIREMLAVFEQKLLKSRTAIEGVASGGIVPTCFAFIPESYQIDEDAESKLSPAAKAREKATPVADSHSGGASAAVMAIAGEKNQPLIIRSFKRKDLPLFLEGPVHYLRLCPERQVAETFHRNMLISPLYDQKLNMIKINAPIASAGQDIGRITIFTPGWLENESVWLHMEYKYMFELLRNGLGKEFFSLGKTALVPFFNPAVYGRSTFENSSFIASSAHPEEALHGQGFVARLSGATAEFISMWIAMTSGLTPFSLRDGKLCLGLQPCLPADFFTAANTFTFNFLGSCEVVYHNESRKDTFGPQGVKAQSYRITYADGANEEVAGSLISGKGALAVREGKVKRIDVILG